MLSRVFVYHYGSHQSHHSDCIVIPRQLQSPTEIFLECLSKQSVFVHSIMLNQTQNWQQTKIVKISPNNVMRVFSNINFANSLAAAVGQGYEAVYHLRLACTISLLRHSLEDIVGLI